MTCGRLRGACYYIVAYCRIIFIRERHSADKPGTANVICTRDWNAHRMYTAVPRRCTTRGETGEGSLSRRDKAKKERACARNVMYYYYYYHVERIPRAAADPFASRARLTPRGGDAISPEIGLQEFSHRPFVRLYVIIYTYIAELTARARSASEWKFTERC